MSLSSAVQWWEDWQLRILVLSNLGVQCYLAFFAAARKSTIRPLYRFSIWLAYLGSDALAIYALATLFNRQKKLRYKTGSHDVEVLWAPILLKHLGGKIGISAYNIEDNELWRRHILTTVSQVAVALYVFFMSWSHSADKGLLAAAILLYILGFLNCIAKPIALKRASFNNLLSSFHPAPVTKTKEREVEIEKFVQEAKGFVIQNEHPPELDRDGKFSLLKQLPAPDRLFVDLAYAYKDRLINLKSFWLLDGKTSYEALCWGLSKTFNITYARVWLPDNRNRSRYSAWDIVPSSFIFIFNGVLPVVIIALFHGSPKEAYREGDIVVTYILLYITYLLEFASGLLLACTGFRWHSKVAQHNLIALLAAKKKHSRLVGIAEILQCKGLIDQYFSLKPCHSCKDITKLVHGHVKDGWINYISDVESYWQFTDMRGQWTLQHNGCEDTLRTSIEKPFDESILLWHVATVFAFVVKEHHLQAFPAYAGTYLNYMVHLLFAKPEMLIPGTRRSLFTNAYKELEVILQGNDISSLNEKGLAELIICKLESEENENMESEENKNLESEEGFIHQAWVHAQELMRLGDVNMWKVIKGVWIEMLCFSAGRCRGYLHAKNLRSGGECLTFVSLLMSHAGLEMFVARQQRVQLRLPKEVRLGILGIRNMKKELIEAVRKRKERVDTAKESTHEDARKEAAGASPEVEIVVSK